MRATQDEATIREVVYPRDNSVHQDVLAGLEPLFIRTAVRRLRPGERILDAFAYHADYVDVTNPFRPWVRIRPALACLTRTRLVQVYAARGGLAAVPSQDWVLRHADDMEDTTIDLADVATVSTRREMRQLGIAHDVLLALRGGEQCRIGSHSGSPRAETIADRIRHRIRNAR